jgi:CubicO group peptidase (beta-lactamase class C family)
MKKRKILFIVFLLALVYASYWIFEPYSLNPFSDKPLSLSKNDNNLNCLSSKEFSAEGDKLLDSTIMSGRLLGVTTGIYSKQCGTWLSSAGYLTKSGEQTPNKSSLFRIASISKSMTAVAILQLVEKGIIDLDAPIQKYLPEFPKKEKGKISIRQLLKHRGGIPHYKSKLGIFNFTHYDNSIKALDKFKERDLLFKPGTEFKYSSYGYVILGAIIEKVTGQSYQDYMNENVWQPAQMTSTSIEQSDAKYKNKAGLYIKLGKIFIRGPKNDLSYMQAGGGIQSTAKTYSNLGKPF